MFNSKEAAPEKVIQQAWHKVGTYIRVEWSHFLAKVCTRELTVDEAWDCMCYHFGALGVLWDLEEITIQIQPHLAHHVPH